MSAWGDDIGITWETATNDQREAFALVRLYWYYQMQLHGGPDGSELDDEVCDQAHEAAEWFGPILEDRASIANPPPPVRVVVVIYEMRRPDGTLLYQGIGPSSARFQYPDRLLYDLDGPVQFWRKEGDLEWEFQGERQFGR